ncbi:MAG: hypothetical protein J1F31_05150 [Erysipelotrichales bacterium]|nr:hypothetical protein [Erysipelotrichales bacterium]
MKKAKFLLLSLLGALTLAGCGETGTSTSDAPSNNSTSVESPSTDNSTSTAPLVETHAVVLPGNVNGAHVYASKTEAAEGETVTITVVLTDNDFALNEVAVNGAVLTAADSEGSVYHFNFLMGEEDANVTVKVTDLTERDHMITFEGNGLAYAIDLPDGANTGDIVSFKVSVQSGNELQSVKVMNGEEEVEVTGTSATGYSFVMPDADVKVVASTIGGYFRVGIDDSDAFVDLGKDLEDESDDKHYSHSEFIWGFINQEGVAKLDTSTFVRAGEKAKVILKSSYYGTASHFYANGVEFFADEENETNYNVYSFTMPASDVTLSVTAAKKEIALNIDADEDILDVLIYDPADTSKTPVTNAVPGTKLYIQATVKEEKKAEWDIKDVNGYFKTHSTVSSKDVVDDAMSSSTTDWSNTSAYATFAKVDEHTKSFTVPSQKFWAEDAMTIKLTLKDLTIFANESFVGEWFGHEFYNYKKYSNDTGIFITINSAGEMNATGYMPSNLNGKAIESIVEEGHAKLLDGRDFFYNDQMGLINYSTSYINNAKEVYVVGKHSQANSTIEFHTYTDESNEFFVVRGYEVIEGEKTLIGAAYCDNKRPEGEKFVMDVDVELLKGTDVDSANVAFSVSKNGEVLKTVGLGAEKGTYTNADKGDLVLDGLGNATLAGATGTYTFNSANNKVTLIIENTKYEITLDTEELTYTINSQTTLNENNDPFKGNVYTGSYRFESWDGTGTFTITVSFGEEPVVTYTQTTTSNRVKDYEASATEVSYTFDAEARTVTFTVGSETVILTFNDDFTTATFTSDIPELDEGRGETVLTKSN